MLYHPNWDILVSERVLLTITPDLQGPSGAGQGTLGSLAQGICWVKQGKAAKLWRRCSPQPHSHRAQMPHSSEEMHPLE